MRLSLLLLLAVSLVAIPALALEEQPLEESTIEFSETRILGAWKDYVDVPKGALSWDIFAQTKEKVFSLVDGDGMRSDYAKPDFSTEMKSYDRKTVKMRGYMFPLDEDEKQKLFLFGPYPMTCPYHYHVGPSLIVEAHPVKPIKFTYDAITLEGTLELVPEDMEYGIFYRLNDAKKK
ncbi:MAG: DUF3299 domain-containing protein [Alphaproteobacteria bacterium]|nr:DUF3299 domain-containing protein [Alphaproteobacteria bacterium]